MTLHNNETCPHCNKSISKFAYGRHVKACLNPTSHLNLTKEIKHVGKDLTCEFCQRICKRAAGLISHWKTCRHNPNRIPGSNKATQMKQLGLQYKCSEESKDKMKAARALRPKLSEETKKKISESRKKYLLEHPEQVPYKLNHKHKETYPERYFKRILKGFVCQYRTEGTLYEIDFANVEKKIAVEIDGEQHYVDKRIVVHDIKRTKILEDLGWKIIRVRWSHYKKLEKYQKLYVISQLMNESMNINDKLKEFIDLRKETTIINKQKIIDDKRKLIDNKIEKIILSGIDCTKYGWVELMKKLLNQKKSPVSWIAKYMPDYYVNCYKR